jgi:hypothetical protein
LAFRSCATQKTGGRDLQVEYQNGPGAAFSSYTGNHFPDVRVAVAVVHEIVVLA